MNTAFASNIRNLLLTAVTLAFSVAAVGTARGQSKQPTTPPPSPASVDPATHAAHLAQNPAAHAAGASQAAGQTIEVQLQTIAAQWAEMVARIERLEAIAQQQPGQSPPAGGMSMGAGNPPRVRPMPGVGSGANPASAGMAGMDMTGGGQAGMGGDPAIAAQLAELHAKMQRLEATIQYQSGTSSGAMPMSGKPGMASGTKPMQERMAGMSAMGEGSPPSGDAPGEMKPAGGVGGMGGGTSPRVMKTSMMEKMKGGMGGGAPAAGAPMTEAAPSGAMGADSSGGAGMGMMDTKNAKMAKMAEMMGGMGGKRDSSMAMPSALPGFPGASHLYHVGATGFFLDHPRHIALSTEQQKMLYQIKEQAALDEASADRCVQEAEQDLWALTAADQPDNAQIEAKVAEIEKLKGDARLRFIGAVGAAANILNDEQRKILTGFAPPTSAGPGAAGMADGTKGM